MNYRFFILIVLYSFIVYLILIFFTLKKYFSKTHYSLKQKHKIEKIRKNLIKAGASEIHLKTSDGIIISALFFERSKAKKNILLCHGYHLSKEFMSCFVNFFPDDNILMLDFRAHGESGGKKISLGLKETKDVFAAIDFLNKKNNLPIVGVGISQGAAALLRAAVATNKITALILDSLFVNINNTLLSFFMNKSRLLFLPKIVVLWMIKNLFGIESKRLNLNSYAKKYKNPLLLIHSKNDKLIPVNLIRLFFDKVASLNKFLWIVDNARHGFICKKYTGFYKSELEYFFNRIAEVAK